MPIELFETIYQHALPALEGKRIKDARISPGLLAVELEDGSLADSYVLRDELPRLWDHANRKTVERHGSERDGCINV
jgi:hypothetical protein